MTMIGICGDNCEYCPRLKASKNGGITDMEKVKELWVRLGLRDNDFPAADMACHGCSPENNCAYAELRACVGRKALENCGLCDAYPCKLIKQAFDKTEKLKARAYEVCTQEEIDMLNKAFFAKKKYFDRIHQERRKKIHN